MASRVLLQDSQEAKRSGARTESIPNAWRAVACFGALLAVLGLGDLILAWYPLRFGNPEWEFGTVASSFAGLPLLSMGLAALLGAGFALGSRLVLNIATWFAIVMGVAILAALGLFLTDVPIALGAAPPEVSLGIKKAVAKTSMLGLGFGLGYIVAGGMTLKHLINTGKVARHG